MKATTTAMLAAAGLLLAACIPSVNPFYTPDDVVFSSELAGTWIQDDERWTFERHESGDGYGLRVSDGEKDGLFEATLFELGPHRFLDLYPRNVRFADDQSPLVNVAVFPGHMVMHVQAIEPQLKLAFFDLDWLENLLEDQPDALSHVTYDDRALLTGDTAELQRFLLTHVEDGRLFADYSEMDRQN